MDGSREQPFNLDDWNSLKPIVINAEEEQPAPKTTSENRLDLHKVKELFPGICEDYVRKKEEEGLSSTDEIVNHILEQVTSGRPYPHKNKSIKRKQDSSPEDETETLSKRYKGNDRKPMDGIRPYAIKVLKSEFLRESDARIRQKLLENRSLIYPTYLDLLNPDQPSLGFTPLKRPRKPPYEIEASKLDDLIDHNRRYGGDQLLWEALKELKAARAERERKKAQVSLQQAEEAAEQKNEETARALGNVQECQCCFGDHPTNRMVFCDNEDIGHAFCYKCLRTCVETVVGNTGFEINCMSTDGCSASFSRKSLQLCVSEKTIMALEKNEMEQSLREAGIGSLENCPFCPFAMEVSASTEEDREFRCLAPDCQIVSCRLCRQVSHIPYTCQEASKENALSMRNVVEEAMSKALIRNCNKCKTPFIKLDGCNKMTCPRCRNMQCYVCSQTCDYNHFNRQPNGQTISRSNCPLYDNSEARHQTEVQAAAKTAIEKLREERPDLSENDLTVEVSRNVEEDERKRRQMGGGRPQHVHRAPRNLPFLDEDVMQLRVLERLNHVRRLNPMLDPTFRPPSPNRQNDHELPQLPQDVPKETKQPDLLEQAHAPLAAAQLRAEDLVDPFVGGDDYMFRYALHAMTEQATHPQRAVQLRENGLPAALNRTMRQNNDQARRGSPIQNQRQLVGQPVILQGEGTEHPLPQP